MSSLTTDCLNCIAADQPFNAHSNNYDVFYYYSSNSLSPETHNATINVTLPINVTSSSSSPQTNSTVDLETRVSATHFCSVITYFFFSFVSSNSSFNIQNSTKLFLFVFVCFPCYFLLLLLNSNVKKQRQLS